MDRYRYLYKSIISIRCQLPDAWHCCHCGGSRRTSSPSVVAPPYLPSDTDESQGSRGARTSAQRTAPRTSVGRQGPASCGDSMGRRAKAHLPCPPSFPPPRGGGADGGGDSAWARNVSFQQPVMPERGNTDSLLPATPERGNIPSLLPAKSRVWLEPPGPGNSFGSPGPRRGEA